jgi:hypothetical protein
MRCFKIGWAAESEGGLPYQWSRDNTLQGVFRAPMSEDEWTPRRDLRFEHGGPGSDGALLLGGQLTEPTKAELRKLWYVTQPKTRGPRANIGHFSRLLDDIPLVSDRLRTAIEGHDGGVFEFVKVETVWDMTHDCPLGGGPFYLSNLLARLDCLDKEASAIKSIPRFDGTTFNSVNENRTFIAKSVVQCASIWRDTTASGVYCSASFRELLEVSGCSGWSFTEVPVVPG